MAIAPTSSPTLQDMIAKGYFPKEVPPPFTSAQLAPLAVSNPTDFETAYSSMKVAHACRYQFARPGSLRRALAIPNPAFYSKLSNEMCSRWAQIQTLLSRADLSISKPVSVASKPRALYPETARGVLFDKRCEYRGAFRYLMKADISQFYPSIYTHSIAWATEGKSVAKTNYSLALFGNLLDKVVQNGQDGQTKGIPIGPDASLVIAELLLSACDEQLQQGIRGIRGFRYYDDYELYFDSRAEADRAVVLLESILAQYEIVLNPTKTKVESVLQPLDHPWSRIRRVEIRARRAESQRSDLIYLFDEALELSRLHPADHILKYTIGRLDEVGILDDNRALYFRLLSQAVMSEHAVLPLVLNQLLLFKEQDATGFKKVAIQNQALASLINKHILLHTQQGNSSEVAWAIWGAIAFKIRLNSGATKAVCSMEDSIISLLALYAGKEKNLMDKRSINDSFWQSQMTAASLRGEHWLLSYEAAARGWLARTGTTGLPPKDQAALDYFNFLQSKNISFVEDRFEHINELEHVEDYGSAEADEPDSSEDIPF